MPASVVVSGRPADGRQNVSRPWRSNQPDPRGPKRAQCCRAGGAADASVGRWSQPRKRDLRSPSLAFARLGRPLPPFGRVLVELGSPSELFLSIRILRNSDDGLHDVEEAVAASPWLLQPEKVRHPGCAREARTIVVFIIVELTVPAAS